MDKTTKSVYQTWLKIVNEEKDLEGQMAIGELEVLAQKAQELARMMKDGTQLEAWVQSKITKAKDYISSVHDYMNGNPEAITETVVHRGDKWLVMNKDKTKVLGTHDSKISAVKQLQAIEIHKHGA